jgi:hypothetical protein
VKSFISCCLRRNARKTGHGEVGLSYKQARERHFSILSAATLYSTIVHDLRPLLRRRPRLSLTARQSTRPAPLIQHGGPQPCPPHIPHRIPHIAVGSGMNIAPWLATRGLPRTCGTILSWSARLLARGLTVGDVVDVLRVVNRHGVGTVQDLLICPLFRLVERQNPKIWMAFAGRVATQRPVYASCHM